MWGATGFKSLTFQSCIHFNPRTPCGVRRRLLVRRLGPLKISIHAPRVGCDGLMGVPIPEVITFQSTHPVWGATHRCALHGVHESFQSTHPVWGATRLSPFFGHFYGISIHAPRVGCDRGVQCGGSGHCDFNPRTPCGVRRRDIVRDLNALKFQSTHPVWGATHAAMAF